ncbi:hypothetical protein BDN67DRAFT_212883 [Paxillus ammoniavirescens]|nr:hypothetical protein BDN67DRAFT_212883 [Paxillus ammoniavirescens]
MCKLEKALPYLKAIEDDNNLQAFIRAAFSAVPKYWNGLRKGVGRLVVTLRSGRVNLLNVGYGGLGRHLGPDCFEGSHGDDNHFDQLLGTRPYMSPASTSSSLLRQPAIQQVCASPRLGGYPLCPGEISKYGEGTMAYTAIAAAFKTFWCREFPRQYLGISALMNQIKKREV